MPRLTNPRREAFAQALEDGIPQTDAYESAGYSPDRGNAATLTQDTRILQRRAEIASARERRYGEEREHALQRVGITLEYVLGRTKDVVERCLTPGKGFDAANALKGLELLGRPIRAFPARVEHSGPDGGPIEHTDRAAEARAQAAAMLAALADRLRGDGAQVIEGAATPAQPASSVDGEATKGQPL